MTAAAAVVSAVIPPKTPAGSRSAPGNSRRPLPVPRVAPIRPRSSVYGFAAIDCNGRVAENTVIRALGWAPGTRLDFRESGGLVLVRADGQGVFCMGGQGYLRLPATVRHWCGLVPGDRMLLAADPADGLLVVHPPAALDAMISQFHASVLGGDAG